MINQETLKIFDELYYLTYQDVLKYVICNCSNIEDVKDIVQNIYLDVLKRLKKDTTEISKAYIMGITKNKVKDYYRFNYKEKLISLFSSVRNKDNVELVDIITSEINIEKDILKEEDMKLIWNYLKKKKVIIPKIFYLYYYLEYSIKDISKKLNLSESNVKNYLYRTLKELNVLLKSEGDENVK